MIALVAARDEARRIAETLAALAASLPEARLVVADDGSSDATASLATAAGAAVISTGRRLGKGGAMTLAARSALAQDRRGVLLLCDGDLGASAGLLAPLADAVASGAGDLAVARFAQSTGGGLGLAVGFARWALRRRCGLLAEAPLSGQRAITRQALERALPLASGYGMELAMTIDVVRAGGRVVEIELPLSHRGHGRTPAGFLHRGRQLADFALVYLRRR